MTVMTNCTFKNKGAQSEHLGGLYGYGLANGADKTDPFEDNTYISSSTILSFCTPNQTTQKHTELKEQNFLFYLNNDRDWVEYQLNLTTSFVLVYVILFTHYSISKNELFRNLKIIVTLLILPLMRSVYSSTNVTTHLRPHISKILLSHKCMACLRPHRFKSSFFS